MEYINISIFIVVVAASLIVGLGVYLSDKKSLINKLFLAFSLTILLWNVFGFLGHRSPDPSTSTLLFRLNFSSVALFFVMFYYFNSYFPIVIKKNLPLNMLVSIVGIFLCFISIFTNQVVYRSEVVSATNTVLEIGYFGNVYYAYSLFMIIILLYRIFRQYKSLDKDNKNKVTFIIVGISLFALFNLIFNIFGVYIFPTNTRFTEFGDYSALFLLGFTSYAITKHQLFNVKIIATQVTVILLSVGLSVETFLSNSIIEGLLKGLIWVLATYGGYVLIKSVKKEIKQKEELQVLAKKLDEANKHLKDLDEQKDNFISMASHELNTPIAAIEGYLSMILDEGFGGPLNPDVHKYLTNVYSSSKRLAALVKDLLNVSRIESNRIHLIYQETQVEDIINQSIAEVGVYAKDKGHTLTFEQDEKLVPKTWCDATRITEVVINFIGNAVKYTEAGGKITIRCHADDGKIVVSVEDNGRGIPKDKQDHIFEKFVQVDVLKDEVKGTGLGMFISKNLIELHEGKIWFKSEGEGKGSTFYFSLPIMREKPIDKFEGQGPVLFLK